jgi:fumarate reductase subunit C
MTGSPIYREYHPRWLRPRVSTYWWLERLPYTVFILREISSVFVAWFVIYLLILLGAVGRGPDSYASFIRWSAHPVVVLVNVVTLFFVLFHAITWFNLAPKAMVVHLRGRRVAPMLIAGGNYAALVVVSAFVVWLLVGGGIS